MENEEFVSNKKKAASSVDCTATIEEAITKIFMYRSNWNEMREKAREIRNRFLGLWRHTRNGRRKKDNQNSE